MKQKTKKSNAVFYILLAIGGAVMVFPFFWMIVSSFKTNQEIFRFAILPQNPTLDNYKTVFLKTDFLRWFKNSLFLATVTTLSVLFFDSLVGYTFAKLKFPGKNVLFIMILSTMMVPTEMLLIPWYKMNVDYGWIDTYWSFMFPGLISAFGIFLTKQFFEGVPNELLEAARMDGISEFGAFIRIAIPLVGPALSALAIFAFLGSWNAFLWPVIIANRPNYYTLPVGLSLFSSESRTQWELIMTAASMATIPVLIVFFIFQKRIIEGIHLTGLKG